MKPDYDIVIVGGGLVGMSLACALHSLPLKIAIVDAYPMTDSQDDRSLVLSHPSQQIMHALNLWTDLVPETTPIHTIHISSQGNFSVLRFLAEQAQLPALGYVIKFGLLHTLLQKKCQVDWLRPNHISHITRVDGLTHITLEHTQKTYCTRLLVAADGSASSIRRLLNIPAREYDYQQQAISTNITLARPHHNIAYERFTRRGLIAMLPRAGLQSGLVWALPPHKAQQLLAVSERTFLTELQTQLGYRLGKLLAIETRRSFPLKLTVAQQIQHAGAVLIGNAAQTLHPIAAQGFNLGLRDAATLAQLIQETAVQQLGSSAMLATYEIRRAGDRKRTIAFTDKLVRLYATQYRSLQLIRRLGLGLIETVPLLKRKLQRQAMGWDEYTPSMACGIAVRNQYDR